MEQAKLQELIGLGQKPVSILAEDAKEKLADPLDALINEKDDSTVVHHGNDYSLRSVVILPAAVSFCWNPSQIGEKALENFSAQNKTALLDASMSIVGNLEQCFGIADCYSDILLGRQKLNNYLVIVARWQLEGGKVPVHIFAKGNLTAAIPEDCESEPQGIVLLRGNPSGYLCNFRLCEMAPGIVPETILKTSFRKFGENYWLYARIAPQLEKIVG